MNDLTSSLFVVNYFINFFSKILFYIKIKNNNIKKEAHRVVNNAREENRIKVENLTKLLQESENKNKILIEKISCLETFLEINKN